MARKCENCGNYIKGKQRYVNGKRVCNPCFYRLKKQNKEIKQPDHNYCKEEK